MDIIKFKKLNDDAILPKRNKEDDAALDIYALEDVEIPPSEVDRNFVGIRVGRAKVPTGICVEIPKGRYGKVVGRSGLAFNDSIVCFEGTIDASYRGELNVLLLNYTPHTYFIAKGDRVAQLIIQKCDLPKPVFVNELGFGSRGDDGLGSSGR